MQFLLRTEKLPSSSLVIEEANPKSFEAELNIFKDSKVIQTTRIYRKNPLIYMIIYCWDRLLVTFQDNIVE